METIILLLFPLVLAACATTTALRPVSYISDLPETAHKAILTDSVTDVPLEIDSPTYPAVSSQPPTSSETATVTMVFPYPPPNSATATNTAISPYLPPNSATLIPESSPLPTYMATATTGNTTTYFPVIAKEPQSYYVSKRGSNGDGMSWATAWNELDQINWDVIEPGMSIVIDGGESEMVYTSQLSIQKSGTSNLPILIRLAYEPDRNGQAIIFGGRSTPLPYCGQLDYSYESDGVSTGAISVRDQSWIIIDGTKWSGITIRGHNGRGMRFDGQAQNITVRNIEIYDNGIASQNTAGEWRPNRPGVGLAGSNITFERALIHDNGQDAFQSMSGENNIADFTIRQSWLYNSRIHPTIDESFNHCRHPDGLQIYDGGEISGVTIEESIIGPGFTQGIILGQTVNENGSEATVNDVTLRNTVFTKAKGLNIMGYSGVKSQRWIIENVTSHCPSGYTGVCLWLEGTDHAVTDSIFSGSQIVLPDGLDSYSGNCQWDSSGFQLGGNVDPLFTDVNDNDPFSLDDYSLQPGSPCQGKGSSITSVSQLLSKP